MLTVSDVLVLFAAFVLWHLFLWGCACWLIGRMAGWHRLVTRFPHPNHPDTGASASGMLMIGENWNGSVVVHADDDGLAVGPALLMAIGHPHFLLPWALLARLPDTHSPVMRATNVSVDGQPLSFYGAAAEFVAAAVARHAPATSIPISSNA